MESRIVLLDTSILIDFFRKANKKNSYLYQLQNREALFAVSTITEFEIYRGCNSSQKAFWDEFFSQIEVLPFESKAAQTASELSKNLKKRNLQIEIPDLLIGATAIANRLPIATINQKHFSRIEGLELI